MKERKKLEDFLILGIYLILLCVAYMYASLQSVKFIPVFTSMAFFALFAESALHKKELIYKLTQKFYKKELNENEKQFLKSGDLYWAISILCYAIVQIVLVFVASNEIWALYSSIGWYIYFVLVLSVQIIYGKMYAIKVSS